MSREDHNNKNENKKVGRLQIILGGICVVAAFVVGAVLSLQGGQVPTSQENLATEMASSESKVTETDLGQDMEEESAAEQETTGAREEYAASNLTEEKTEEINTEPVSQVPKYDTDVKITSVTLQALNNNYKHQLFFDQKGEVVKDKSFNINGSVYEYNYLQDAEGNAALVLVPGEEWCDENWFEDELDKNVEECYSSYRVYDQYNLDETGCYVETSSDGDKRSYDERNRIVEELYLDPYAISSIYTYGDGYILIDEQASDKTAVYGQRRYELDENGYVIFFYDNGCTSNYGDNCWGEVHYTRNEQHQWITKESLVKNIDGSELAYVIEKREFDSEGRVSKYECGDEVDYLIYGQDGQLERIEKVIKTSDGAVREAENTYTYDEYGRLIQETVQSWSNYKNQEEVPYYMVEEAYTVSYNEKGFPVEIRKGRLNNILVKRYYGLEVQNALDWAIGGRGDIVQLTYEYDQYGRDE